MNQFVPDFDFARPASKPRDRRALVEYIYATPALQETDYLEWKSSYDLSKRTGAVKVAKHLIGFANRTVAAAGRHLGGHAYLVLGVEPGSYAAVEEWDTANIQDWLERYIEPELAYQPHYVIADGNRVLMFDIDPPKPGNPVFALQKASEDDNGKTMPEATIYVRRLGKTEVANSSEFKALQARLQAGGETAGPRLALDLRTDDSGVEVLPADLLTAEHCRTVLTHYRKEAVAPVPTDTFFPSGGVDLRTPEGFVRQVNAFIAQARTMWWELMAYEHAKAEPSWLNLAIVNDTEENFEDVQVELRLPLPRRAVHAGAENARSTLQAPRPPTEWGKYGMEGHSVQSANSIGFSIQAEAQHTTLVTFAPVHVRPRTPTELSAVLLTLDPSIDGQALTARWRATARNTKGDLSGEFTIQVGSARADGEATA